MQQQATHTLESALCALKQNKRTFSVTFIKKDGSVRVANASFRFPPVKGTGNAGTEAQDKAGFIRAIDRNKQRKGESGYVCFLPENVIRIKSGKIHFEA